MRVYWLNGALTVHPENEKEMALINELISAVKYEPPYFETVGSGEMDLTNLPFKAVSGRQQG